MIRIKLIVFIFLFAGEAVHAQTLSPSGIWAVINQKGSSAPFAEKGFKVVYGGPKKQGGFITLIRHKTGREYLFIDADSANIVRNISYYVPDKKAYMNLMTEKKQLLSGEDYAPMGLVEYEGKKYYHVTFSIIPFTPPPLR